MSIKPLGSSLYLFAQSDLKRLLFFWRTPFLATLLWTVSLISRETIKILEVNIYANNICKNVDSEHMLSIPLSKNPCKRIINYRFRQLVVWTLLNKVTSENHNFKQFCWKMYKMQQRKESREKRQGKSRWTGAQITLKTNDRILMSMLF